MTTDDTARIRVQRFLVAALQGVALLLLGLHFYVRTLPPTSAPIPEPGSAEARWWGLWPITYLPAWAMAAGAALVIGAIVVWWLREIRLLGDWVIAEGGPEDLGGEHAQSPNHPITQSRITIFVSALLFLACFLFPLAHTRWGDAFMLANGIAYPDPALRLTHSWQAPLDVFAHSQLWLALHATFGWEDAVPVYRLLSPLAGGLYLLVVLALSRDERLAPGWLTYGLLASLGLIQLFFGYVENYSFAAAGVLAYLWVGIGGLRGTRPLWQAAGILAVTNATHPSTVILAPSLLYLAWRQVRNKSVANVVVQVALPILLVGGATFLWMEWSGHGVYALLNTDRPGGGDARWFAPLWTTTTRWEHYTMFSGRHLRDWLNEQLLVAPVVLPGLVVVLVGLWAKNRQGNGNSGQGWEQPDMGDATIPNHPITRSPCPPITLTPFLAIAAAGYLLFTFVWNPDYGGQRDWDLFSLAALPATLLFVSLLPKALPYRRMLWGGVLPLILLQAWHTAAWIYQNTLPWQWPD